MRTYQKILASILCYIIATVAFTACEWDNSPEPDHPLFVTYTISAGVAEYTGSNLLLQDINTWIKANQRVYDVEIRYTSGDASEFTQQDADAVKAYESFAPKFKAYLDEVKAKLAKGDYEPDNQVDATLYIFATRTQGESGNLKYEQIRLVYPDTTNQ